MASTLRGATKRFLVRTGNEALLEAYRVWRTPYDAKRDARDIANIKLLITACLRHDSNAIDIGANRGLILRSIVHRAPNGHHVAFEPLPWIAEQLRKKFPNVEIHEMALADETGEARFRFVPKDPALSALPSGKAIDPMFRIEQLTVRVGRLDDVLPRDYHPHFIKIDVEGAEDEVISGAVETLRRWKPLVVFEHGARSKGTPEIYELLTESGYDVCDIDGGGPYTLAALHDRLEPRTIWNLLAVPR